jgi:hypothetical protein
MKPFVLSVSMVALLSGIALAAPAQAGSYQHRHGKLTYGERHTLAVSKQHLNGLRARARADGHVNVWERMQIRSAAAKHRALAHRLRHN